VPIVAARALSGVPSMFGNLEVKVLYTT
jgi:hypothetical protein